MKIAILTGHSRNGDKGAVSVGGVSEWEFNTRVGALTEMHLHNLGIECEHINWYGGSSYGAAVRWVANKLKSEGFTHAIEQHFNSSDSPQSNGHEFLFFHSSKEGKRLARCLAESHQEDFPFSRPRHSSGLKPLTSKKDRGFLMAKTTHCPFVIDEPFFGSNPEEWHYFSQNIEALAASKAKGIAKFLGKTIPLKTEGLRLASSNHAIAILTAAAENAENNAPILDSQSDAQESELSYSVAKDCRAAIAILKANS